MASKKKEGIIIVLDVGKNALQLNSNGKSYFEQSLHCVSMLIQRKLLLESKDELALILFGSSNTNNPLALEGPGYQNIEVVTNLGLATWDLAKFVTNITPTNITPSDWLSALILATHLLKNESENKIYSDLQIVIFSNFMADILPDKIDVIVKCINYLEIKLSLLGKDYTDIVNKNQLLEKFIEETDAQAANLEVAVNQLSYYKHKDVVPRAWTVALSFGSIFSIKVSGFKKVDETPKTNKWLLCSKLDKPEAITPIKTETSYYYVKNGIKIEVNKFNLIDAFRFGDTIIPVTVWKFATIILIPKPKKPKQIFTSYRPISLLSVLGKLFDKILLRRLHPILSLHNIVPNSQLGFIDLWTKKWRVKINEDKSAQITFTLNFKPQKCPQIIMNNIPIPIKEEIKYLGITLDKRLMWGLHLKEKRKSARNRLHLLRPLLISKLQLKTKLLYAQFGLIVSKSGVQPKHRT
ncbi:X-ray repair cross-complementing protein 5-like [Daktulosphaira vitifoliae]|uniref:X-ray repair cross-complementing protein 5-like n=1 Tax=Daktulosphaira vitifoliae TaxID=58002 RepID=UPI0021AAF67D|nr:X-ray repair cross-complementing protein 5-like [Daktulosphaira vitifoliae]